MQVDTARCSNCKSQILLKCIRIHEREKPAQGFFSKLFSQSKKQPKYQEDLIPCTQCGESVPFSLYAIHQEQCVGHQLMKCDQCQILFPTFLFDEHLQVCTVPKPLPPIRNALVNMFEQPQERMYFRQQPQKIQRMIPEEEQSDDEQLAQMIGVLARREIQNSKLKDYPLKPHQVKQLHQIKLQQSEQCSICCCQMTKNKNHVRLNCTHTFHTKCISSWLAKNPLCPMCRQHALKK